MVQHELVRHNSHRMDPIPVRAILAWRSVFLWYDTDVRPWIVDPGEAVSDEDKRGCEYRCCHEGGNKSCSDVVERRRAARLVGC